MKTNLRVSRAVLALTFAALAPLGIGCAAPTGEGAVESSREALGDPQAPIAVCPLGDLACVPPQPTPDVIGAWERHAGSLVETLTLRADHTYALVETTSPVCFRAPCPELPSTVATTAGTYEVKNLVVALSPETPDARLPEAFDVVLGLTPPPVGPVPPITTTASTDGATIVSAPVVALHAVERGSDVRLTRAAPTDCPTGTTKCYQCGKYPPGGVCTTFVCLPPTQRCLPVP